MYKSCTTPAMASPRNVYEVEVRLRLGNSSTTVKTIVEASSSFEAQRIAQTQVRYQISTSVVRYRQLK